LATVFATSAVAAAQDQHDLVFPAGVACEFGLAVDIGPGGPRVDHTFTDAYGNPVRILSTGVGNQLTFTNLSNGATTTTSANGAVTNTVFNADGSQTVTLTGHNILILFPTDVPAGPSTTLYVGRVVFTVDANKVTTLTSTSGRATDICATLS
jgi:uncharacterized protein RhaS with RHS repeats